MPIEQELINEAMEKAGKNKEYAIMVQVGQAVALPTTSKYTMKITVGGFEIDIKPKD